MPDCSAFRLSRGHRYALAAFEEALSAVFWYGQGNPGSGNSREMGQARTTHESLGWAVR